MYLVFDISRGRYIKLRSLPKRKVAPPEPAQIKWEIEGWPQYCICCRRHLWHRPYATTHGRRRGWQLIRKIIKNGYGGFTFRKENKPYWMSTRQLRQLLERVR
jgi:hypothetical protein